MTGSVEDFIYFAKKKNENIIFIHCFLHREALVKKTLVGDLRKVFDQVVKEINYIKNCSLKSRSFEKFCEGMDSDNSKLLSHNAIRWLSRGRILSRFYDLSEEIIVFLTKEESKFEFLEDEKWWTKVSFLTDIFELLNKLNISMQSRNENILISSDKIMAFNEKLTLWKTQVDQKKLTMFPRIAERNVDAILVSLIKESIMLLSDKMTK
ncbi:Hypothetical protein CINCED_3A023613 [Cinara cedri]|uniref:Uncharacterized protein n=1 Tax=Cinara cedri TaxID=506608 RepID=A0A5E4MVW2_9HEMI|nr:Hypothetical protein CINCED_3A023613 [Cinara cedri]